MSREQVARKELAAAFRWAAHLNFHEAVANHFSMAVSDDGQQFVVNRAGTHFSQVTASGLVMVDTAMKGDPLQHGVDPTAWVLHSYLHRNVHACQAGTRKPDEHPVRRDPAQDRKIACLKVNLNVCSQSEYHTLAVTSRFRFRGDGAGDRRDGRIRPAASRLPPTLGHDHPRWG